MKVFIAGNKMIGLEKSHARTILVSKVSHRPLASFAIV